MYLLLSFFLQNIINLYCAATISFCLVPKYPRRKIFLVYGIISFVLFTIKFYFFTNEIMLAVSSLLLQLSLISFTLFCHRDTLFRQLVVLSAIQFGDIIVEFAGLSILSSLNAYSSGLNPGSKEFSIAIILVVPAQIMINLLFQFFWKYVNTRKSTYSILIFSLLPMLQLLVGSMTFMTLLSSKCPEGFHSVAIICSVLTLCCTIVLLFLLLKKEEKKSLEEAYLELKELYQLEAANYQALEVHHEELAKLRHDFNNQLSTLYMLISSGQMDAAREFASSLKKHAQR